MKPPQPGAELPEGLFRCFAWTFWTLVFGVAGVFATALIAALGG